MYRCGTRPIAFSLLWLLLHATNILAQPSNSTGLEIPFLEDWQGSPHAQTWDESFLTKNQKVTLSSKGHVPKDCARCHSTDGFHDYLGIDGSEVGVVETEAVPKNGVSCIACHNSAILDLEVVTFPSGESVERFTPDVKCMQCHQGRQSGNSVRAAIDAAGVADDEVSAKLEYLDGHYLAAATRFGSEAGGGFEYAGNEYDGYYFHDEEATLCIDCHSLHTEKVAVSSCDTCHRKVKEKKDFRNVRRVKKDFDGDGNVREGIAREISTLQSKLYQAIRLYADSVAGKKVVLAKENYPYFFYDANENGRADENELTRANSYKHWTPRLLRTTYNLQYTAQDPGSYIHNPFYTLQLLFDSLQDLAEKVAVDTSGLIRP